jgi:hypothetical protein
LHQTSSSLCPFLRLAPILTNRIVNQFKLELPRILPAQASPELERTPARSESGPDLSREGSQLKEEEEKAKIDRSLEDEVVTRGSSSLFQVCQVAASMDVGRKRPNGVRRERESFRATQNGD